VGDYFFDVSDLLLAFVAYASLNILLTGIPVPSGNFTGTMLIGGMFGRTVGNLVRHWYPGDDLAKPGVYAMMGSAAMLCGFKRMSMAVVLFIAECGDDWNLIPPLMVTVASSLMLNQFLLKTGFDEEQIMRKNIPFLEPEAHEGLYGHAAKVFIDESVQPLPLTLPIESIRSLLQKGHVYDLPVVGHDNICIGFTTKARIQAALTSAIARSPVQQRSSSSPEQSGTSLPMAAGFVDTETAEDLCLDQLVDRSPYKVDEDMPAQRVYQLFAKAGINSACVVTVRGEFRGVITRANVSKVAIKLHGH
jgi:chloride channel 7